MKKIFDITVAKDSLEASSNEDAFDYDYQKQVFALSDGASESYNSKKWAEILVREFVDSHNISQEWILNCIKKYLSSLDLTKLTESQFIAFNKGSFATLIAIQRQNNELSILNVGDSHVFIFTAHNENKKNSVVLDKDLKLIELFKEPIFANNPTLISTKIINNDFIDFEKYRNSNYFRTLNLDYNVNDFTGIYKEAKFSMSNSKQGNNSIFSNNPAVYSQFKIKLLWLGQTS